jgi:hypothetical protein
LPAPAHSVSHREAPGVPLRILARTFVILVIAIGSIAPSNGGAQPGPGGRRVTSAYFGGDNIRVTAGRAMPHVGMHNWDTGMSYGIAWESWDPGRGAGPSRVAVGLAGSYSRLPFSRSDFAKEFESATGKQVTQATASAATIADLQVTARVRGPTMLVMPSLVIGVGYYNFSPSTIAYQATDTAGTARTRGKSGPSANIGLAVDGPFIGRTALFAEALYAYGWSSDNQLSRSASSRCGGNVCDTFKSTQTTLLRGGVRLRLGRL